MNEVTGNGVFRKVEAGGDLLLAVTLQQAVEGLPEARRKWPALDV